MSRRRHTLWRWWERIWFQAGSPRNLAAARIVFGLHALWILLSRDLPALSGLPPDFWTRVSTGVRWRYLLFPGHTNLEYALQATAIAALVGVVLGLRPRISCLVAALILYHLAPLETFFWTSGPYERGFDIDVIALVALAFSPCADVWSLRSRPVAPAAREEWEYHWPLRLAQVFVAQVYLFAGYSKLHRVGLEWISAWNLRRWLLVFNQQDQLARFHTVGAWAAEYPALCLLIAIAAVSLDLGFITAVFWVPARRILIPVALSFHLGILLAMNIAFLNAPQLLIFVNWDWVARRIRITDPVAVPARPGGG